MEKSFVLVRYRKRSHTLAGTAALRAGISQMRVMLVIRDGTYGMNVSTIGHTPDIGLLGLK
jgi:hypothetical protein